MVGILRTRGIHSCLSKPRLIKYWIIRGTLQGDKGKTLSQAKPSPIAPWLPAGNSLQEKAKRRNSPEDDMRRYLQRELGADG